MGTFRYAHEHPHNSIILWRSTASHLSGSFWYVHHSIFRGTKTRFSEFPATVTVLDLN